MRGIVFTAGLAVRSCTTYHSNIQSQIWISEITISEYIFRDDLETVNTIQILNEMLQKWYRKYIKYTYAYWPALWSSGQSSWLQIQRSGFDFRGYQIFWEVVGLERGPLSLVSTTEELLGKKKLRFRSRNVRIPPEGYVTLTTWHHLSAKLALTSSTSGCRSVDIIRSQTQATEFIFYNFK
jgi:hypothetical protein